jgi:simple sugar transport system ATP-binding protein
MPILEMRGITKRFPGVTANDHINFSIEKGEIHGLLGENGAGKTTLMSILSGIYVPDEGEIFLKDKIVRFRSPKDAIAQGIGMVHQHFTLVNNFTVAENILLGLKGNLSLLKIEQVKKDIAKLGEQYGLKVSPEARLSQLSTGEKQRVEILKVLYRGVDILILDEPTSALTPQESKELFKIMRSLSEKGTAIVFVTHKLREALEITDRITVLRDGKVVSTIDTKEATAEKLARMMCERDITGITRACSTKECSDIVLEVNELCALKDNGLPAIRNICFSIHAGEIFGIAGVAGNGQKELAETIAGLRRPEHGQIKFLGKDITHSSANDLIKLGISYIPDDKLDGLALSLSTAENLILKNYHQFVKNFLLDFQSINNCADELIKNFNIKCSGVQALAMQLSGGNLQRLMLARELSSNPKLMIVCSPTRGLDIAATEYIQKKLVEQAHKGTSIILISEDLNEVLDLCDRIAVMYDGSIMGIFHSGEADIAKIGLMMGGMKA